VVPDNCRMLPTSLSTRSNAFLFFVFSLEFLMSFVFIVNFRIRQPLFLFRNVVVASWKAVVRRLLLTQPDTVNTPPVATSQGIN
jgi:hypothetical protein